MSEERLDELREILYNPNLKGYLPNVCNELLQQVTKQKEVIEQLKNSQYCPYDKKCGKLYECTKQEYEDMCNVNMKLSLENDDLRHRLENAKNNDKVVDKVNWENQLLQRLDVLEEENQELKKQLEETEKCLKDMYHINIENDKELENVKTQQKEFKKYLEDEIQNKREKSTTLTAFIRNVVPLQQCLQKYKSIIGVSDEKTN